MAAPFPHRYEVELLSGSQASGRLSAGPRPAILGAPPPEFDGPDDHWSPEHLLLSSVVLCLMTTYQAFASRARLHVARWAGRVEGVLDKTEKGLAFVSIRVEVDLSVDADQVERAETLMESAKKHCIVSNALRTPVTVEARVSAATAVEA